MRIAFEEKVFQHDVLSGQQCIALNTIVDEASLNLQGPEAW